MQLCGILFFHLACTSGFEYRRALCELVFRIIMFIQARISDFHIFSRSGNFLLARLVYSRIGNFSSSCLTFFPEVGILLKDNYFLISHSGCGFVVLS